MHSFFPNEINARKERVLVEKIEFANSVED